jgi:hypothetical protein
MNEPAQTFPPVSKAARRTGQILSALSCLMLFFSAGIKLVQPAGIPEHFAHLGWPLTAVTGLGVLELACTVIYLMPRTGMLGAILLTGYLGGATATHVRIGEGMVAFQVGLGVALWAGLYLRDPRLRALLPLKD